MVWTWIILIAIAIAAIIMLFTHKGFGLAFCGGLAIGIFMAFVWFTNLFTNDHSFFRVETVTATERLRCLLIGAIAGAIAGLIFAIVLHEEKYSIGTIIIGIVLMLILQYVVFWFMCGGWYKLLDTALNLAFAIGVPVAIISGFCGVTYIITVTKQ